MFLFNSILTIQCIGLKEFAEYLSLPRDQRRLVQGDRLFESGCELLKLHTRQYARRQDRWITNRFLRQTERQVCNVFVEIFYVECFHFILIV